MKLNKYKVPLILQLSDTECGIAALAMVLAFYQYHLPVAVLREKCGSSRDGTKAVTLLQVAEELGFNASAFKIEPQEIHKLQHPLIAFWNFSHYVVICRVKDNKVFINDPAQGNMIITMQTFAQAFSGIIIDITPKVNSPKLSAPHLLPTYLKNWFKDFKQEWFYIILVTTLMISTPLLNSLLMSIFINYGLLEGNNTWLPWLTLIVSGTSVMYITTIVLTKRHQFKLNTKVSLIKLIDLTQHILKLPFLFFINKQKNELLMWLTKAESVYQALNKAITEISINFLMSLIALLVMLKINVYLALCSLGITCITSMLMLWFAKTNLNHEKMTLALASKHHAFILSAMRNVETIKASHLENNVFFKWYDLFCQKINLQDKQLALGAKMTASNQFMQSLALLIIIYGGMISVARGLISLGQLLAYYAIHLFLSKNIFNMVQIFKEGQEAFVLHARLHDLNLQPQDKRYAIQKHATRIDKKKPILKCHNINFSYAKNAIKKLQNINLEIYTGQQIAIVGASGSGKSTLAKLLCGLLPVQEGAIYFYGQDLAQFTSEDFAKYCAYVAQDVTLFSGTLYENITLWQEHSFTAVNYALQQACLQKLIAQRGLYAQVTEQGNNFSGGEKQRIEIARALLQDTPLLILDEATSALDTKTETELIKNLQDSQKTIVYVTHRLTAIEHCDQILVMANGQIIEYGTHQYLLQNKNYYYRLFTKELIQEYA